MRNHEWAVCREPKKCVRSDGPSKCPYHGRYRQYFFFSSALLGKRKIAGIKGDNNSGPRLMATPSLGTKCFRVRSSWSFCCWQTQKRRRKRNLKNMFFWAIFLSRWDGGNVEEVVRGPGLWHNQLVRRDWHRCPNDMSLWCFFFLSESRQMNYIEMAVFTGFTNTGGVAALEVKVPPHRYRTSLPPTLR